jgi:hypothetical protein
MIGMFHIWHPLCVHVCLSTLLHVACALLVPRKEKCRGISCESFLTVHALVFSRHGHGHI